MDYFNCKIILIILIILILIFNLCTSVFASYDFTGANHDYILPDDFLNYEYVIVFGASNSTYVLGANTEFFVNYRGGNLFVGFKQPSINYIRASKNNKTNYDFSNDTVSNYTSGTSISSRDNLYSLFSLAGGEVRASNFTVKNSLTDEVYFESTSSKTPPTIENDLSSFELLDFDYVKINANGFSNDRFYFDVFDLNGFSNSEIELYQYAMGRRNRILLTSDSPYYNQDLSTADSSIYWIPKSDLGLTWKEQGKYRFEFVSSVITGSGDNEIETLELIGEPITFTLSQGVALSQIEQANQERLIKQSNEQNNSINNQTNIINNTLTNTTPDSSISSDIDDSLNFNNDNEDLNNLNGGFFSRLTTMLSNLLGYNLADDTTVSIPLPNSEENIILHSKVIYDNVSGALRVIINAFWVYIFSFYMWKFINKIYIAVSTGNILDTFSSSGEAITNDML